MSMLSTALSDALLAACSAGGAVGLRLRGEKYASTGLAMFALAASCGSLRFGGVEALIGVHDFTSALAGQVGLPLIGVAYASAAWRDQLDFPRRLQLSGAVIVLFTVFGVVFPVAIYKTAIGAAALVLIAAACASLASASPTRAALGGAGAVLTAIAALGIGTEGALGPVPRIDVFHVALSLANLSLATGLPPKEDPVAVLA